MKKVLSFVLILALVLSSFSMAFAGSSTELKELSDVAGNTNEEAIEVNYDLGIVTGNPDGTFQPEKAVTRAEFAAMITRALAIPQSALAGYANTSFKDTTGYTWAVPYLAFCNSKGIMLGDGAGNAMPGKTITVNEAVTMALRAIGYTANSAELTGVWPSNYVTKAQELKLYDDVAKDATGVDKANAAQIIYNTLGVQKVAVNSDGKTEKLWDVEPNSKGENGVETTLLSSGLNCKSDGFTVVTVSDLDESLINMAKHIGKYGKIYRNDSGKGDVVAFIEESDTTLVGRFYKDGSTLKFVTTADEQSYTVNATTVSAVLVNGAGNVTDKNIKTEAELAKEVWDGTKTMHQTTEFAISVDVTGKTIKDVYGVNAWVADQADQIEKSDIDEITNDQSLLNEDFPLDDDDKIDYTKFNVVGVKSLKDIAADNVVYVYTADDDIVRVEVGTQVAEGIIKNFKDAKSDTASKFAIGANTYKNASEVANGNAVDSGSTVESGNVSDEVKAFLDARGNVYDFTNSTKANNYAVVKKVGGIDQAQFMLADGTVKTMDFDDSKDKAGKLTGPSLIGYGLNSSGTVTDSNKHWISATQISLSSLSVIDKVVGATVPAIGTGVSTFPTASIGAIAAGVRIDSNCVVFTYDDKGDSITSDLDVTTLDKVETGMVITSDAGVLLLFDENNDGSLKDKVVAMLIPDSAAKGGDKSYAVINDKDYASNDDGDKVWEVTGFKDGSRLTKVLTDDQSSFDGLTTPIYSTTKGFDGKVCVFEVKVDANGIITKADKIKANSASSDVYRTQEFTVSTADDRKSVVAAANGINDGAPINANTRYAISSKAVIYSVDSDGDYAVYTGKLKDGDFVQLFETDDDEDGFDIVVVYKK